MTSFAPGITVRRDAGLYGYERALEKRGLHPVAGVDEAGRGACAGPLVAAAVVLDRPIPGLAVWKGDQVTGSIAAASVIAKVTRDRLMVQLHERFPAYDFATHKGYVTDLHDARLREHGPCAEHRLSFVNVRAAVLERNGEGR